MVAELTVTGPPNEPESCPLCGAEVDMAAACPGYDIGTPGQPRYYRCNPPCGNAWLYKCRECDWYYQDDILRPRPDMGVRPGWLK